MKIFHTSVVKYALLLYDKINNCNMRVTEFRQSKILSMIEKLENENVIFIQ